MNCIGLIIELTLDAEALGLIYGRTNLGNEQNWFRLGLLSTPFSQNYEILSVDEALLFYFALNKNSRIYRFWYK